MMKNVAVSQQTLNRLSAYMSVTNGTITGVVEEALNDWLDTVATARLEELAAVGLPATLVGQFSAQIIPIENHLLN